MDNITPDRMCFGLSDELDRQSFRCFLQLIGDTGFSTCLAERVSPGEIEEFVDAFTRLMKKHISEDEYHTLFLQQNRPPKQEKV